MLRIIHTKLQLSLYSVHENDKIQNFCSNSSSIRRNQSELENLALIRARLALYSELTLQEELTD